MADRDTIPGAEDFHHPRLYSECPKTPPTCRQDGGEEPSKSLPFLPLVGGLGKRFKAKVPLLAGGLEDADGGSDRWPDDGLDLKEQHAVIPCPRIPDLLQGSFPSILSVSPWSA